MNSEYLQKVSKNIMPFCNSVNRCQKAPFETNIYILVKKRS